MYYLFTFVFLIYSPVPSIQWIFKKIWLKMQKRWRQPGVIFFLILPTPLFTYERRKLKCISWVTEKESESSSPHCLAIMKRCPLLSWWEWIEDICTVTHCLTTGIRSDKCIVRRFSPCVNIAVCTYTNLDGTAYCTPTPYGTDLMGLPSCVRSIVDGNVMWRMTVLWLL